MVYPLLWLSYIYSMCPTAFPLSFNCGFCGDFLLLLLLLALIILKNPQYFRAIIILKIYCIKNSYLLQICLKISLFQVIDCFFPDLLFSV